MFTVGDNDGNAPLGGGLSGFDFCLHAPDTEARGHSHRQMKKLLSRFQRAVAVRLHLFGVFVKKAVNVREENQ